MNLLAGCEKSIVTDTAGTTRDIVEETVNLGDVVLAGVGTGLLDYAGVERWNVFDEPVLPDAARRKMYERYYREYLELYRSLKPNMERMATVVKELNGGGDERGR